MANHKRTRSHNGTSRSTTFAKPTPGPKNTAAAARAFVSFTPSAAVPHLTPRANTLLLRGRRPDVGTIQLDVPAEALQHVIAEKKLATTHVYKALDALGDDLGHFFPKVSDTLPPAIDGVLLNPDGVPAAGVMVEAAAPVYGAAELAAAKAGKLSLDQVQWPLPHALTDQRGAFRLDLPTVPAPSAGLQLHVRGGNGDATLEVKRVLLLEGHLGTLPLPRRLTEARVSIVTELKAIQTDLQAHSAEDVAAKPEEFASPAPQLQLGEDDCGRFFRSNSGVIDTFRYSVLVRLIEPQMNQWQPLFRLQQGDGRYVPFALPGAQDAFWSVAGAQNAIAQLTPLGHLALVNRTPVDQPIDVSDFHRRTEEEPVYLPKASTLGLGYVVHMAQTWIPAGLSLGDLVYSLPLAPGEQQRLAVEEQVQTFSERELETLDQAELQTFRETDDSSALATFRSAFDEVAAGGSHVETSSRTSSRGATASTGILGAIFGGGGVSAGYSSSSSSGSASSWQNVSRDFTSSAAQEMHAAVARVAAASRHSSRTRMRLATASERTQVTTRVVTNHNKSHALTLQWWQVLRHFAVSSTVDDVQLVCFVPLELVQFLPHGQPFALGGMPSSRADLLARYAMVLRYWDVLYPALARNPELAYGMRALRSFAADPSAKPETSNLQQDVLHLELSGGFLPFEEVSVTAVGRSGARLGPIKLAHRKGAWEIPSHAFASRDELLEDLRARRRGAVDAPVLAADVALPDWMARSDIARFDVVRRSTPFSYFLKPAVESVLGAASGTADRLGDLLGAVGGAPGILSLFGAQAVLLGPDELERELGGPVLRTAAATLQPGVNLLGVGSFQAGEPMGTVQPLPALRVGPVLSYNDLLKIEAAFQHVVRNGVRYSKAVWQALGDEERAILLERFTIGVPQGGITGADQEVPLLNCVANRVLGYFGNAAIMPFAIPPDVAQRLQLTSRDVQDALLRFHRQAFQPPRSSITLPTRGTLGEAVLGCCNSAEKIDLTRFWNWQDSPADGADPIPSSAFTQAAPLAQPAASAGAAGAGGGAGAGGSMITIANGGAPPSTGVLEKLIEKAPDLATALNVTGLDALQKQLSADTASAAAGRKEAIDSVTTIQTQAMKSAESVVKSVADAVASVYGGGKATKSDGASDAKKEG